MERRVVLQSASFDRTVRKRPAEFPCAFGLSPKFSTPVEKTVEKRRESSPDPRAGPVFRGSLAGRNCRIATGWAFRATALSEARQNRPLRQAKPRRSPLY